MNAVGFCSCETPVFDAEHDAGCRRCGLPIDFTPRDPILHVPAAFWCDDDHADEIADFCKRFKVDGSRGAVVTFSVETADRRDFRHTMSRPQLAEINSRPGRPAA